MRDWPQRCIREMLEDCPGSVPYIDDILVYRKMKQEHDHNLERVLRALHVHNFCLQQSKCQFHQKTVKHLGHILSGAELRPNPDTVAAIDKALAPQTPQQLSSFLDLVGFYTDFLHDLATKAEPLRALNRKEATFSWSAECQMAFEGIKRVIGNDLVWPSMTQTHPPMIGRSRHLGNSLVSASPRLLCL